MLRNCAGFPYFSKFVNGLNYAFLNVVFAQTFQHSPFLEITTLVTWLQSTLLLKIKCLDTHIYLKTECLQTNKTQHLLGKENTWGVGSKEKSVALIKSLIDAW